MYDSHVLRAKQSFPLSYHKLIDELKFLSDENAQAVRWAIAYNKPASDTKVNEKEGQLCDEIIEKESKRGSVYCRSKRARLKKKKCHRCATLSFEVDLALDSTVSPN